LELEISSVTLEPGMLNTSEEAGRVINGSGLELASEPAHLPVDCGMLGSGLGLGLAASTSY